MAAAAAATRWNTHYDLRSRICMSPTRKGQRAMYKAGGMSKPLSGKDTLTYTCLRARPAGTCPQPGGTPHTPFKCFPSGLCVVYSLTSAKTSFGGADGQAMPDPRGSWGGVGVEHGGRGPRLLSRSVGHSPSSGSNGAADCPSVSLSTPAGSAKRSPWQPRAGKPCPGEPPLAQAQWPWAPQPCPCSCWLPAADAGVPPRPSDSPSLFD